MELIVSPTGEMRTIYSEELNLAAFGAPQIVRASHVEPDEQGGWSAQIIDGPKLGPFDRRSQAIEAEVAWLIEHRLRLPN